MTKPTEYRMSLVISVYLSFALVFGILRLQLAVLRILTAVKGGANMTRSISAVVAVAIFSTARGLLFPSPRVKRSSF